MRKWWRIRNGIEKRSKKFKLALNMIVKNEAHIIQETLENVMKYTWMDSFCIVDTGSTDKTIELIVDFFKKAKNSKGRLVKYGEIHHRDWKNDFSWARNEALKCCEDMGAENALIMDADDIIVGDFVLPKMLTANAYSFKIISGITLFQKIKLSNYVKRGHYVGSIHEVLVWSRGSGSSEKIEGNYALVSRRLGDRSKDPKKYEKDAMNLLKRVETHELELLQILEQKVQNIQECKNSRRFEGTMADFTQFVSQTIEYLKTWDMKEIVFI